MMLTTLVSSVLFATPAAPLGASAPVADSSENAAAGTPLPDPDPVPDDIRALDDLRRLAARVQCDLEGLRQMTFDDPVGVSFADREWLNQAVRERWDEVRSAEQVAFEETSAKLLGMLDPGASLREEELRVLEQSGAFFDSRADELYLLDTGREVSPLTVAAGLSGALVEQQFESTWGARDMAETDGRWVREAVQSGSHVALLLLWALENLEHVALQELSEVQRGGSRSSLADSPPYVWKPMLGLSLRGEAFLRRNTSSDWISPPRLSDLDHVAGDLPLSTEQILHPDKYWTSRRRDDPTPIGFDAGDLPDDWSLVYQDTLGEMALSVLTEPFDERRGVDPSLFSSPTPIFSRDEVAGWDGDRVALLQGEGGTIVHLVTAWDSPEDGQQFLTAVDAQRYGILENLASMSTGSHGVRVETGEQGQVSVTSWIGPDEGVVDCVLAGMSVVSG